MTVLIMILALCAMGVVIMGFILSLAMKFAVAITRKIFAK
jgi:hypothetical protein